MSGSESMGTSGRREYAEFLKSKNLRFDGVGVAARSEEMHANLFPFARDVTAWALRKGRAAIFSHCGTSKTRMQVQWAKRIPGRVLIFAPLCVAEQTIAEALALDVEVVPYGKRGSIEIINYEMLHRVNPEEWDGVVLDESSILKSMDGKTRTKLIEAFQRTRYRLCCTATPAPNDPTEIGNHSHFLGIMTRAEMLASFFVNRGEGNKSWDLKGHAREAFYRWLASWSCFLKKPSDLGYSDEGFDLPPLNIIGKIIPIDMPTPGKIFADKLKGVSDRAAVRRMTASVRVAEAAAIIEAAQGQVIAWCGLNDEQSSLAKLLGVSCVSVDGSQSMAEKVSNVRRFLSGEVKTLVSKLDIVGFGMNLQCAATQVYVGLGDSWEKYLQGICRSHRYGQVNPVNVHIVLTSLEEEILLNVKRKGRQAEKMQDEMVGRIVEFERDEISGRQSLAPYSEEVVRGNGWELWRGDACEIMPTMEAESVDLAVFSPPFSSLYTYSSTERDMGNSKGLAEFLEHFGYFVRQLRRIMKPGRIVACHCQQLTKTKTTDGVISLKDFRGDLIRSFEAEGMIYHGEIVIDKNPQAQAIRTKSKSLLFVQLKKDSSWMRPAMADYVILLRTPGENAVPIIPDCSNEEWIEWAHPIWYHIRESDTLQVAEAREAEDEKHICALQLPTIRRCIRLWSNRDEVVFSPFAGIGSEGYEALKAGRRFKGIELKAQYHKVGVKNLAAAEAVGTSVLTF